MLKNLQMDKPAEYRRQLDMEIHSALYRDDSAAWAQDGLGEMHSMPGDEPFNDIYQSRKYFCSRSSIRLRAFLTILKE